MANRTGMFRQIWQNIMKTRAAASQKDIFIGRDVYGNKYYERPADPERGIKRVRRLQPVDESDPFHIPKVPVEWTTWLQGRRNSAPSQEEIDENYVKMIKTQHRAKELEKERMEEKMLNSEEQIVTRPTTDRVEFPKYDDYEVVPGDFDKSKRKNDPDS